MNTQNKDLPVFVTVSGRLILTKMGLSDVPIRKIVFSSCKMKGRIGPEPLTKLDMLRRGWNEIGVFALKSDFGFINLINDTKIKIFKDLAENGEKAKPEDHIHEFTGQNLEGNVR